LALMPCRENTGDVPPELLGGGHLTVPSSGRVLVFDLDQYPDLVLDYSPNSIGNANAKRSIFQRYLMDRFKCPTPSFSFGRTNSTCLRGHYDHCNRIPRDGSAAPSLGWIVPIT